MKLAIVSDFHLGYERFHDDAYSQAEQALEMASAISDAILIPGDIFDSRVSRPEVLAEGINLFRNLAKKQWKAKATKLDGEFPAYTDIPVIAIPGTHERRGQGTENPVSLLNLAGLLVDASESKVMIEKEGEYVAVTGIGGMAEEKFRERIKEQEIRPNEGAFNVFMFHQSLSELLPFSKDFASIDELPSGFDLYVDGHIHNKIERKVHGKLLLIPGSTVLTQLKENEQEEKGFYVYDTKTNSFSFNKIKSRRFIASKLNIEGKEPDEVCNNIRAEIDRLLSVSNDMPIIKIELDGNLKLGFKTIDANFSGIGEEYKGKAIVEISKSGMGEATSLELESLRGGMVENVPVKDLGLSIFIEKLKQSKYDLQISPSALFEMLSGESKEKATKKVIEELFK